jgi:hypothetical protein
MRKLVSLLASVALTAVSGAALAHNCPNEMKAIDAKLAAKPTLSKENSEKVAKLRKQGEEDHKAGKHADSMKSLGEAKKLLGI